MRSILVVAVAVAGLATFLDSSVAAAAGWSLRFCRAATEASAVNVWVAKEAWKERPNPWLHWKSDDARTDFALPADLAKGDKIWLQAESEPVGGKFAVCALYDGKVARHIHATSEAGEEITKTDRDDSCPCAKAGD